MAIDNRWNEIAEFIAIKVERRLNEKGLINGNGAHQPKIQPRLLTVKEAAEYLGRPSESAVYKLIARREIPVVRHGRHVRLDRLQLDKWIASDAVGGAI